MANIKIAQLTNATTISDTDIVLIEDAAQTKKMTVANLKSLLGINSGGVVDSGSNANGSYIKFADGTMICKMKYSLTTEVTGSGTNQSLTIFKLVRTWIFPVAFYDIPTVVGSAYQADYGLCATSARSDDLTQATVVVQSLWAFNAYALASTDVIAIGRWKA